MQFERHLGGHGVFWIGIIQAHGCDVQDEDKGAETVDHNPLAVCDFVAAFS